MKTNQIVIISMAMIFVTLISCQCVAGMVDPSAYYCNALGFTYIIDNTGEGQRGVCVIKENVTEYDSWDFFTGKVGQEYSYCAKNNYSIRTLNDGNDPYSQEYSVCIINNDATNTSTNSSLTTLSNDNTILGYKSVSELMNLNNKLEQKLSIDNINSKNKNVVLNIKSTNNTDVVANNISPITNQTFTTLTSNNVITSKENTITNIITTSNPIYFDYRHAYGYNWLTPVKDQASCGSCWAFAAVGAVEAYNKMARMDYNLNIDLSEEYLLANGVGNCTGGWSSDALSFIQNHGIPDENCDPYISNSCTFYTNEYGANVCNLQTCKYDCSNSLPSDSCSTTNTRLWKIDNYGSVPPDQQDIKNYLLTKGPLVAYISMDGIYNSEGVYTCNKPNGVNHAVVIVGYNDSGGYWIVRNSWGSNWNDNGYFKVGYGQCNIEMLSPLYIDLIPIDYVGVNQIQWYNGHSDGSFYDLFYNDSLYINYTESPNYLACTGYEIWTLFNVSKFKNIDSFDILTIQKSTTESNTFLNYWNQNDGSWELLGNIPTKYNIIKYNICDSLSQCSNYISQGTIFIKHYRQPRSFCLFLDSTNIDMLMLEAKQAIDTDYDGLPDSIDKCPTIPGPLCNDGCPITAPPDINIYSPFPTTYSYTNILVSLNLLLANETNSITKSKSDMINNNITNKLRILDSQSNIKCLDKVWMNIGTNNILLTPPYNNQYFTFNIGENNITIFANDTAGNIAKVSVAFNVNLSRQEILCQDNQSDNICPVYNFNTSTTINDVSSLSINNTIFRDSWSYFEINWTGWHFYDPNYWAFFLVPSNASELNYPILVNTCNSYANDYDINNIYTMHRLLLVPRTIPVGNYTLIVTEKDYPGYCYPLEPADAVYVMPNVILDCFDRWMLNDTWSICSANDTQYKNYIDFNYCYKNLSYINKTETQYCDYCEPNLTQINNTCSIHDTFISWYNDTNNCYLKTGLDSDKIPDSQAYTCDYCLPNWTQNDICQSDDSTFLWYNDSKNCYKKTNLTSDLNDIPQNMTTNFSCDYNKDGFIGNFSNINTTITNLNLSTHNITIIFSENNDTIIEFDFNLSQNTINFAHLIISEQSNGSKFAYLLISGLNLTAQNKTKTVYLNRILNGTGLCIKDQEIANIIEYSSECKGPNEVWLPCNGSNKYYTCNLVSNNTRYKISGLTHSGIKEQLTYCGDNICNGGETCSSCQTDCGKCAITPPSGGGGGGGSRQVSQIQPCNESWSCAAWLSCTLLGIQNRVCNDINKCGTVKNKPIEAQNCTVIRTPDNKTESKVMPIEKNNIVMLNQTNISSNQSAQFTNITTSFFDRFFGGIFQWFNGGATGGVVGVNKSFTPNYGLLLILVILVAIITIFIFLSRKKIRNKSLK